jgi:hypothetical protein
MEILNVQSGRETRFDQGISDFCKPRLQPGGTSRIRQVVVPCA